MTMRHARNAVLFAAGVLASFSAFAVAQDTGPTIEQRREVVRRLPPAERERLRASLERFRALPRERQDELRAKVTQIGATRLENLAGRDFAVLRKSHERHRAELDRIFEAIGEDRLAGLTQAERAYMRAEALRGFQRHVKRRMLGFLSIEMMDREWEALRPDERKARMEEGWRHIEEDALTHMPAAEADRIRALRGPERRAARERIFHEFRLAEALEFSKRFEGQRLRPFLAWTPAVRAKAVARWEATEHWYEAARRLTEEVGVDAATVERMAPLPASDWARINYEIRATDELPADRRRQKLTELVDRLAGLRASAPAGHRHHAPIIPQVLRHRWDGRQPRK